MQLKRRPLAVDDGLIYLQEEVEDLSELRGEAK
jgi:hypothetical protein